MERELTNDEMRAGAGVIAGVLLCAAMFPGCRGAFSAAQTSLRIATLPEASLTAARKEADEERKRRERQLLDHRPVAVPGRFVGKAKDQSDASARSEKPEGAVFERQDLKTFKPFKQVLHDRGPGCNGLGSRFCRLIRGLGRCFGEFFRGGVHTSPTLPAVSTGRNS